MNLTDAVGDGTLVQTFYPAGDIKSLFEDVLITADNHALNLGLGKIAFINDS